MAKRHAGPAGRRRASTARAGRTRTKRSSGKRPTARPKARAAARHIKKARAAKRAGSRKKAPRPKARGLTARRAATSKVPRLDRDRRTLPETMLTPPSSLNMDRHGSAARTGRAELAHSIEQHTGMTPALTGGDVDADWENAYFSGDEAPGGDNPTPDQEVVQDIGKSLGVEYQDAEELKGSDKVVERDKHRWELDPASSEDYKDRK